MTEKDKCPTCGGRKKKITGVKGGPNIVEPCPDCKPSQEPADHDANEEAIHEGLELLSPDKAETSEFVSLLRVFIGNTPSPYCYTAQLEQRALEACDRLEAAEKEIAHQTDMAAQAHVGCMQLQAKIVSLETVIKLMKEKP